MVPYYTIMKLPGEADAEYIQMLPYTPGRRTTLPPGWSREAMRDHYGQLVVFQFPKQTVIFGPRQIAARISRDRVIAPQITLWNQQGSEVIRGQPSVIPIEESLLYIRPLCLRAANGRIPELKRVVVAYQNHIVMEETLDEALERLFPAGRVPHSERIRSAGARGDRRPPRRARRRGLAAPGGLASEAQQHYQRALEARESGDWARYGEEIRQLGDVLRRMNPPPPQGRQAN